MPEFTLYGTSACHLCELAEEQLEALLAQGYKFVRQKVDISDHDDLISRYGVLIPVLRRNRDGAELNWPFQSRDIINLL